MDRTSAIHSSFNIDTPPPKNDELEQREIILIDSITVDRDNKGAISTEIISNDKIILVLDSDVSKQQTSPSASKGFLNESSEANKLKYALFSVNKPLTTKTIIQNQGKLTNFFPIVRQSPVSNLTAKIDMDCPNYIVDASAKGTTLSIFNAILEHEDNMIDEEFPAEYDPLLTNLSSKNG